MQTIEENRAIAINQISSRSKLAEIVMIAAVGREHMAALALAGSSEGRHHYPKLGDTTYGFQDGSYLHMHADGSVTYN